jgi:hypothetical protein
MKRILALNWKNPHSARLQRAIGCQTLVCAWRADIGRWLLANVERVRVGKSFGMRTYEEFEDVPVVWKVWQDDDGSFLDIMDPQLVSYIRKCDGTTLGMLSRSYGIEPVFNPQTAKYDPTRFNPIGSTSTEVSVGVVWHTVGVKSLDDQMAIANDGYQMPSHRDWKDGRR